MPTEWDCLYMDMWDTVFWPDDRDMWVTARTVDQRCIAAFWLASVGA